MIYQVIWSEKAKKDLQELDKKISNRIISKVEYIKEQPFSYIKHLINIPLYSLRVGNYRVILDIKNKQMMIFVVKIGHRKNIYKELGSGKNSNL